MKLRITYSNGKSVIEEIQYYNISEFYLTFTDMEGNVHYIYHDKIAEIIAYKEENE